jgi:ABC-type branched-subunit amino acid transport system substrate-binding protein
MPAAAILVAVTACSSSSSSQTTNAGSGGGSGSGQCSNIPAGPITLANILPLSGPQAQPGNAQSATDESAVQIFNKNETICGHSVVLENLNDKGDPATALTLARQIISENHDLMLNDSFGQTQDAIHPYLMKNHVVVYSNLSPLELVNQPNNPTTFSTGPSSAQYATAMVQYAKSHNENNLGIIQDGTPFGIELAGLLKTAAQKEGLTLKSTQAYSPTAVDLTAPLTTLRQAGVQTLLISSFSGMLALVSGLKQIGWSPAVVSWGVFNSYGISGAQLPPNTVDLCYVAYSPQLLTPLNVEMMKAQQGRTGANSQIEGVLLPYASLLVYKQAIEAANSLDGAKVAAQIENLTNFPTNIPGLNFTYTADNHWGYPSSAIKFCHLKYEQYYLLQPAP